MCHHYESTGEWETLVRKELEARREEAEDEEAEPRTDGVEPEVPTADD